MVSRDAQGRQRVGHGGAGAGVNAQLTLAPDQHLAVAVLVNAYVDRHVAGEIADATLDILQGQSPGQTVPAPARSELAPKPADWPTNEWVGTWAGVVSTPDRDLPVRLSFHSPRAVEAHLGDQATLPLDNANAQAGTFTGRMEGDIGAADAKRRPYRLVWDLALRDGVLTGTLNAVGRPESRGVGLGYWVKLRKRD